MSIPDSYLDIRESPLRHGPRPLRLVDIAAAQAGCLAQWRTGRFVGGSGARMVSARHEGCAVQAAGRDAAVAVGYALAVTYPTAGNIGGGGFMTIRLKDGTTTFLDFRERAPLASTKTMVSRRQGRHHQRIEHQPPRRRRARICCRFEQARIKYGTQSREDLMAPAIRLARDGFVQQGDIASLKGGAKKLARDKAAAAIFLKPDGKPDEAGETLIQPDLEEPFGGLQERSGRLL